ncbi:YhbY family RNA-binding protein [Gammaproteobacteria bacterium]|nr:YhbY family RNA-binding protein [Gammaproteobacteria bacterium]
MSIDNRTLKQYRTIGHRLSPVVIVANGLSDNINKEIARALKEHELIKVRVHANDRDEKKQLVEKICKDSGAELVQLIGHIALIHKASQKPNPKLSNLIRHKELLN